MNQPNRIDSWILEDDEKPLTITEDPKVPNAASIFLRKTDHTLGNMIRAQLLLDPTVLFAGYKVPHPLENNILLKIQTDESSNPADALKRACNLLIAQTLNVKKQFMDQANNIEMGVGPETYVPYDPYGEGNIVVGGTVGEGRGAEVYDF
ncbi:DNA-directed RNA polymerase II subunit RPB11, partial [Tremellales sp. Uapishka_1]